MDGKQVADFILQYGLIFTLLFFILSSPLLTLWLGRKWEDYREKKQRKSDIFKTLLATRGSRWSQEHVKALNMLDVEFYGVNHVRHAWNHYRGLLNTNDPRYINESGIAGNVSWELKSDELFTELLYEIAKHLKYDFDKNIIANGAYTPRLHGNLYELDYSNKSFLNAVLTGKRSIKVQLDEIGQTEEEISN